MVFSWNGPVNGKMENAFASRTISFDFAKPCLFAHVFLPLRVRVNHGTYKERKQDNSERTFKKVVDSAKGDVLILKMKNEHKRLATQKRVVRWKERESA